MFSESHSESESDMQRREVLLAMPDFIANGGDLPQLCLELTRRVRSILENEVVIFALHDSVRNSMRVHVWGAKEPLPDSLEVPVDECATGWCVQNQQPVIVRRIEEAIKFPICQKVMSSKKLQSLCVVPLATAQRLGALGIGSSQKEAYGDREAAFLRQVAEVLAVAVENVTTREALHSEQQRLRMLLEVSTAINSTLDTQKAFSAVAQAIRQVIRSEVIGIALYQKADHAFQMYCLDSPLHEIIVAYGTKIPFDQALSATAFASGETRIFNRDDLIKIKSRFVQQKLELGIQSFCSLPLVHGKTKLGALNLGSKTENAVSARDIPILEQIAAQLATALDHERACVEIADLTTKLKGERVYVEGETRSEHNFEEIVGESAPLKRALALVATVAPLDATVLLLGETGTGKELIARAMHRLSARKDGSFIKLNCAAIPTGLLESELFGHEKGAFTGAVSQKIGRLELADRGTLLLDEVGDIPAELQPKLLRVLQDQEFERLGGTRTIKVNVRLIAATNRDLAKGVAEGEFRGDLYYRLNVFPITAPALRERRTDIPLLVRYFVRKFALRMNKGIETIPTETMNALTAWDWPGNVRELENFIERSVILTTGDSLNAPVSELRLAEDAHRLTDGTLDSFERAHILRALRESGGVIAGMHGAALRLGMKRTTLQSKMQRMGIAREEYAN